MHSVIAETRIAIKNILFATDFDVSSGRALPFAVALRDRFGATLFVAHVVPEEAYIYSSPELLRQVVTETDSYASDALSRIACALKHDGGGCRTLLGEGDVPWVLVQLMVQHAIDLAVIGTGSRGGVEKVLLGSVAEAVIREAPSPVLTVGPNVTIDLAAGVQRILCVVDFSPESLRAAGVAMVLAAEYCANLTLLHVGDEALGQSDSRAIPMAEQRLRNIASSGVGSRFKPSVMVKRGRPGECILREALDSSAELIALGVRGAGAFAHAASHFGSIAHQVLSRARCPVLTTGSGGPGDRSSPPI